MKRILLLWLMAAPLACADEIDDQLQAALTLLESEEPSLRDQGQAILLQVAVEAGTRLKPLLSHPDAEVRGRVSEALERMQIIPEEGKTARLRELFKSLSEPGRANQDRLRTVREALDLDGRVASFIAHELRDGTLRWVHEPAIVVPPGEVTVRIEAEAAGDCAAWARTSRWYALPDLKPFGERPGRFSGYGGAAGGRVSLVARGESPEKAMIRALAAMVRVPAGGRQAFVSYTSTQPRCGILTVRAQALGYSEGSLEASFSGATLALPEPEPEGSVQAARFVIGEVSGKRLRARTWEDEGARGLEVTALEDIPAIALTDFDPFWWVALGENGTVLEEGAFGTTEKDLAALGKGDSRRIAIGGGLPAGTKTLWMGFSGADEECVPAAVQIR